MQLIVKWVLSISAPIAIGILAYYTCTLYIPYILAWMKVGFTFLPEGRIITIMRGESAARYLMNVKDYDIDAETGKIIPLADLTQVERIQRERTQGTVSKLTRKYGIVSMGFPYVFKQRVWHQRWNKITTLPGGACLSGMVAKEEDVDSLVFQYVYGIVLTNLETLGVEKDGEGNPVQGGRLQNEIAQVEVRFGVTVQITDAQKVQFKTVDYVGQLTLAFAAAVRDYVAQKTIQELISGQHEMEQTGFINWLKKVVNECTGTVNPGIDDAFGMKVVAINFISVEPSGTPEQKKALTDALAQKVIKGAEAAGVMKQADGEAYRIFTTGKANADAAGLLVAAQNTATPNAIRLTFAGSIGQHKGTLVIGGDGGSGGGVSLLLGDEGGGQGGGTGQQGQNPQPPAPRPPRQGGQGGQGGQRGYRGGGR